MTAIRTSGTDVPSYTETWPCERESASKARRLVSHALSFWGLDGPERSEDVLLIASELVSNAITHSGHRSFRIRITRLDEKVIKVSVSDASRQVPLLRAVSTDCECGRGLRLINALSASWGYDRKHWGKTVWAECKVPAG
ncbi:ATP-binding protein [Streptomyces sp. NPDC002514]|uniref:ATP-binding protein n=1 Tax=Streptomyces sp. NPDC001270 TaxID=3364554 RepID=UPI00368EA419